MASKRLVTRNPPKIFIPAKNTETAASKVTGTLGEPICKIAPRIIIDEIAFVTGIKGVCNE